MNLLRHGVASLVIFTVIVGLFLTIYGGLVDGYDVQESDNKNIDIDGVSESGNIMEQFNRLNLIEGISEISTSIAEMGAGGGLLDILGALAGVGLGVLKAVFGLISAPYSIFSIIVGFYFGEIPGVMAGIVALVVVYVGFILLSAYLKEKV